MRGHPVLKRRCRAHLWLWNEEFVALHLANNLIRSRLCQKKTADSLLHWGITSTIQVWKTSMIPGFSILSKRHIQRNSIMFHGILLLATMTIYQMFLHKLHILKCHHAGNSLTIFIQEVRNFFSPILHTQFILHYLYILAPIPGRHGVFYALHSSSLQYHQCSFFILYIYAIFSKLHTPIGQTLFPTPMFPQLKPTA